MATPMQPNAPGAYQQGGMSPSGMTPQPPVTGATPQAMSTTSLDLPASIQQLLTMPSPSIAEGTVQPLGTGVTGSNPQYAALDFRMQPTRYEMGGQLPPAGINPAMGAPTGPMNSQMVDMQVNEMMNKNPELVARVRAALEAGIQSGAIDQQELNMAVQLAQVVLQNPEMYPQMRQFAIQRGIVEPNDLPVEYDQGLVMELLIAAKAMKADVQIEGVQMNMNPEGQQPMTQPMPMQQQPMQQPQVQEMEFGGLLVGPSHDQGGIRVKMAGGGEIEAEGGEYVIPKSLVAEKGTAFFDDMLEKHKRKSYDKEYEKKAKA